MANQYKKQRDEFQRLAHWGKDLRDTWRSRCEKAEAELAAVREALGVVEKALKKVEELRQDLGFVEDDDSEQIPKAMKAARSALARISDLRKEKRP